VPDDPSDPPPPPSPGASGSVDVRISDAELPAAPAPRKRATTASVVAGVAERMIDAAGAMGHKVGDVVGESLSHLPVVPKTRRGRVLARSILVSFCLVFAWISVIVGLQLRGTRPPDFRPRAEELLIALRDGQAADVYAHSSERFQEVVLEDSFVDKMADLNRTLGPFKEITAVVATETNRGPGGRTGRVDLRLEFTEAPTKGSISFRWEDGQWKLLGLSIEVPKELFASASTPEARHARVQGDVKEMSALVDSILGRVFAGQVEEVWHEAAPNFTPLDVFARTVSDQRRTLGAYHRVLSVTNARINPDRSGSSVDVVVQFDNATIKGSFNFTRIDGVWRMWSYKLVLPLPQVPGG
jgi:hypothetical protein